MGDTASPQRTAAADEAAHETREQHTGETKALREDFAAERSELRRDLDRACPELDSLRYDRTAPRRRT